MKRVAIVGGGIAGLSAAYYVEKAARAAGRPAECTVLEADRRVGGKIVTERVEGGYVVEGGPDSFVTDKPWGLELCYELGLQDDLIPCRHTPRSIYMLRGGRPRAMPAGFRLGIPTQIAPFLFTSLFTPLGKLRMGLELFVPARRDPGDESLAGFVRRRLGRECLERMAGPLMAGIFVSDPERLSLASSFPRFQKMEREHGSLIRAMRAAKKRGPPPPGRFRAAGGAMFNSLKAGMGRLIDELAGRLAGPVRCGARAVRLARAGSGFRVETEGAGLVEADAVVLALPAFAAADLVREVQPDLAQALRGIRYVHSAVVSLAYRRADIPPSLPLDAFGLVVPSSEPNRMIACTWSSVKFDHRAPADGVLMRVFVGGHRSPENANQDEAALVRLAREEMQAVYGLAAEPLFARVHRWLDGNPQFDVGHLERVDAMEKMAAAIPGLVLAGSAYRGVGIPDCVHSGQRAAERLAPILA
jgi:protoporphyrinogen/coproporphyrinogen III oxidase